MVRAGARTDGSWCCAVVFSSYLLKFPSQSAKEKFAGVGQRHIDRDVIGMRANASTSTFDYHNFFDLISQMLQWRSENRITPLQALDHPFFPRNSHNPTPTSDAARNHTSGPMLSDRSIRSMEESGQTPRVALDSMTVSPPAQPEMAESALCAADGSHRTSQPHAQAAVSPPSSKEDKCLQVDLRAAEFG